MQYWASDEAIRTAQWALRAAKATVRNKCLRHWMDDQGVGKQELYALCKHLAQEFEFAQKLNSQARQASAERAWAAISTFYRRCRAGEKQKGYPQFQKNGRSVEYKQSGWKLAEDGKTITYGLRPASANTDGNQAGTLLLRHAVATALYCNGEARQLMLHSKINRVRVVRRADGYDAQFCLDMERQEQGEYTGRVKGLRPADASGKVVIAVPPEYTTQECSGCGHLVKKTLSTRTHQCPRCGLVLCRDQNAALLASAGRSPHILRRALKMLGMEWNSTVGHTGTASQEGTPGEMSTSVVEGKPNTVSAVVEPGTRIPGL